MHGLCDNLAPVGTLGPQPPRGERHPRHSCAGAQLTFLLPPGKEADVILRRQRPLQKLGRPCLVNRTSVASSGNGRRWWVHLVHLRLPPAEDLWSLRRFVGPSGGFPGRDEWEKCLSHFLFYRTPRRTTCKRPRSKAGLIYSAVLGRNKVYCVQCIHSVLIVFVYVLYL